MRVINRLKKIGKKTEENLDKMSKNFSNRENYLKKRSIILNNSLASLRSSSIKKLSK